MCEVTGSSRSYVITDGAQKEFIKPFYTFTDCVCSLLFDIGPRRNHSPVRYIYTSYVFVIELRNPLVMQSFASKDYPPQSDIPYKDQPYMYRLCLTYMCTLDNFVRIIQTTCIPAMCNTFSQSKITKMAIRRHNVVPFCD